MRQLLVNADDLGMTRGINRAIIEAHRSGILTSTSLLANGAALEDAITLLRQAPDLSVGLHVNLTQGKPVAAGTRSSLVDRRGYFYAPGALARRLSIGAVPIRDLEAEVTAQARRLVGAGITLSHFDSHHNVHLHPRAGAALASVAGRMDVRWIRFRGQRPMLPALLREAGLLSLRDHARHLLALLGSHFAGGNLAGRQTRWIVGAPQLLKASPRQLLGALMRSMEEGVTEWVCHPGYADDELRAMISGAAAARREAELKLLIDPDCKAGLKAAGIELVDYARQL